MKLRKQLLSLKPTDCINWKLKKLLIVCARKKINSKDHEVIVEATITQDKLRNKDCTLQINKVI